jgi:hypothetical protein
VFIEKRMTLLRFKYRQPAWHNFAVFTVRVDYF